MNHTTPMTRWLRRMTLLLAVCAGSAQAAVYTSNWDPEYGSPFPNLGWRGTADYFVPTTCEPAGTADINNVTACDGLAIVTAAQVELYNFTTGLTVSTLVFNPASLIIGNMHYDSGELTQLSTSYSDYVDPAENLWAFGVGSNVEFSLFFTLNDEGLPDGPHLAWQRNCSSSFVAYPSHYPCTRGINNPGNDPLLVPEFTVTRVPEPGTLALACLALLVLAPRRLRGGLLGR